MIERQLVAEEERLVGHHRFDDIDGEPLAVLALQCGNQPGEIRETGLAHERQQTAFDEIVLLRRQHEAGPAPQKLADVIVIGRCHGFAPRNERTTRGPI